jgi:hypothetical protein
MNTRTRLREMVNGFTVVRVTDVSVLTRPGHGCVCITKGIQGRAVYVEVSYCLEDGTLVLASRLANASDLNKQIESAKAEMVDLLSKAVDRIDKSVFANGGGI